MINKREMINIIRKYVDSKGVSERRKSATFLIWFLHNMFDLDEDTAVSCICDNKGDKGIDGIYVDSMEQEIHIFQVKFTSKEVTSIGEVMLRDLTGVHEWFKDSDSVNKLLKSSSNLELKSLIENNDLEELISADYEVKYNLIINAIQDKNTEEFLEVSSLCVWDIDEICKRFHLIKKDPFVKGEYIFPNIKESSTIELKKGKVVVVPILASELIKLKGIDDLTLFDSNVRFGLGNTRVNKSIVNTLNDKNEKENFTMFHNGISIVCNKFKLDNNSVKINDYSIVNGAQSTLAFYENQSLLDDNVRVITKIIQTGEDDTLSDLITRYSNNQNPTSMRDLRSNDSFQTKLINQFEELDEGFRINVSYVPKRGKVVPDNHMELNSDYAAQLITTCYLSKPYDTHLKSAMFDSKYRDIFNKNIDASKIYFYFKIHEIVKDNIDKIDNKAIGSYGLAQFSIVAVFIKTLKSYEKAKQLVDDPKSKYLPNIENHNADLSDIFDIIVAEFNYFIKNQEKQEDFIYKNYFKNREKVNTLIDELTRKTKEAIEKQKVKLDILN